MDTVSLEAELTGYALKAHDWARSVAAREGTGMDLTGLCARASARLLGMLQARGWSARVVVWQTPNIGHVYVECEGFLIDVTASQFGKADIEVHALHAVPKEMFWRGRVRFDCVSKLRAYLIRSEWPGGQVPHAA